MLCGLHWVRAAIRAETPRVPGFCWGFVPSTEGRGQSAGGRGAGHPGAQSRDTRWSQWTQRDYYKGRGKRRVIIIITVVIIFGSILKVKNKGSRRLTTFPFTLGIRTEVIISPRLTHRSSRSTFMHCLRQNGSFFINHKTLGYVHEGRCSPFSEMQTSHILPLCFMKPPCPKCLKWLLWLQPSQLYPSQKGVG